MAYQLDPEVRALLQLAANSDLPELHTLPPNECRSQYRRMMTAVGGDSVPVGVVVNKFIPGPGGNIPVRMYRPAGEAEGLLPVLVYFHGGGWVFGDLDSHDHVCRRLCHDSGGLVVAVDYRMGPEHKFPAAVEDALAAVQWVAANASDLGLDGGRLAVGGDSAGGNLAAVVAQLARDAGGPDICFQMLVYPATDLTMSTQSHRDLGEGYRLTRPLMDWCAECYLGDESDRRNPLASPLLTEDLSALPPAYVITAGFDPLRDEGLAYVEKLKAAEVRVDHVCYEGMIHGFFSMPGMLKTGSIALHAAAAALRSAWKAAP